MSWAKTPSLSITRDSSRVIVLAGMGQPGTFRQAEFTVLARELVWMLGRSGRKHLQTVLIGSGAGNLRVPDAVRAWLRGVRRALYDAAPRKIQPQVITFTTSLRRTSCSSIARWSTHE